MDSRAVLGAWLGGIVGPMRDAVYRRFARSRGIAPCAAGRDWSAAIFSLEMHLSLLLWSCDLCVFLFVTSFARTRGAPSAFLARRSRLQGPIAVACAQVERVASDSEAVG